VSLKLSTANVLALSQGDVQGLAFQHATVHLRDSLCGVLRGKEANESEPFRFLIIVHNLGRRDVTKLVELTQETRIVNVVG
jgi:hypothetical protein